MHVDIPEINVNLKSCSCSAGRLNAARRCGNPRPVDPLPCDDGCAGAPVIVRCPLPPVVTFLVVREECTCKWDEYVCPVGHRIALTAGETCADCSRPMVPYHADACPAQPVEVTCRIGGDGTWEESKVTSFDPGDERWGKPPVTTITAMRARWEVVKALVLGRGRHVEDNASWPEALFNERDVVFAKLKAMAVGEQAASAARKELLCILPAQAALWAPNSEALARERSPSSARFLERCIERLIAQVGEM